MIVFFMILTLLYNSLTIENDYQHQLEELICRMQLIVGKFY